MFSKALNTFSNDFRKDFRKTSIAGQALLTVILASTLSLSQPAPAPQSFTAGLEFPVIMRQNVAAGATPVGTKVQAKLTVATLLNGVVIPQDAILSGEVIESVAKSATDPSRLAIRMDSAQWKNRSAPIKVYLTSWYYPAAPLMPGDFSDRPAPYPSGSRKLGGNGAYRTPVAPAAQPFPGGDTDPGKDNDTSPASPSPGSNISQHRVLMKKVESTRNHDGAITLTSKHFNIKLDKQTTYVLAAGEPAVGPS